MSVESKPRLHAVEDLPDPDDTELVARFRAGDSAAFDTLVRRYQRRIFAISLRYVRNPDDAADVTQRALVQALVELASFRGEASFRTWVYRIATNLAMNLVRDRKHPQPLDDELVAMATPTVEAEDRRRLRAAVATLPPRQRLVVELRVFEELSFREIADVAECSVDSAKVNFHHALQRLRAVMNEEEP